MRDLQTFETLRRGEFSRDALGAELARLGGLTLAQRVPYLGFVESALAQGSVAVKIGALQALAGANGRRAFRALLRALQDDSPRVVSAAVDAFAASAVRQPQRWVHLLFHPDSAVRRMALERLPRQQHHLALYLLPDPELGAVVRGWLEAGRRPGLGTNELGLLLALWRNHQLEGDAAAALLETAGLPNVLAYAAGSARRDDTRAWELVVNLAPHPLDFGSDTLDLVFGIVFGASTERRTRIVARLLDLLVRAGRLLNRRAAASVLQAASFTCTRVRDATEAPGTTGAALPTALPRVIVCQLVPELFGTSALPREVRRDAARGLLKLRNAPALQSFEALTGWLRTLVHDQDGAVDLSVVAGLLRLAEPGRSQELLDKSVGNERVLEALLRDPASAAPLLSPRCLPARARRALLDNLRRHSVSHFADLVALSAWVLPADQLSLSSDLSPDQMPAVARALFALEQRQEVSFTPSKQRTLSRVLCDLTWPSPAVSAAGSKTEPKLCEDPAAKLRIAELLVSWLELPGWESLELAMRVFGDLSRGLTTDAFVGVVASLAEEHQARLVRVLPMCPGVSFGKELALALALETSPSDSVRAWAVERVSPTQRRAQLAAPKDDAQTIVGAAGEHQLISLDEAQLARHCARLAGQRSLGLPAALAQRPDPSRPLVEVAVALLGAGDDPALVVREFRRFSSDEAEFLRELDVQAVSAWSATPGLPLLGAAWLWRWERQATRVGQLAMASEGGLGELLDWSLGLEDIQLRQSVWFAVARCLELWGARDKNQYWLAVGDGKSLGTQALSELDTELGSGAANLLLALYRQQAPGLQPLLPRIRQLLPDVSADVAKKLSLLLDTRGYRFRSLAMRRHVRSVTHAEVAAVRGSRDLAVVATACKSQFAVLVEEAVLRLLELPGGDLELASLLEQPSRLSLPGVLADSISLWSDAQALARIRRLLSGVALSNELKFRAALGLCERDDTERAALSIAYTAACADDDEPWFKAKDYQRLCNQDQALNVALELVRSPHPHAYRPAVTALLVETVPATQSLAAQALKSFLEVGCDRDAELRLRAAAWLLARGDDYGFPLLIVQALEKQHPASVTAIRDPELFVAATRGVMLAGETVALESAIFGVLRKAPIAARDQAFQDLLLDAYSSRTAEQAVRALEDRSARSGKLHQIAELFAWGFKTGLILTGRHHRPHMTSDGAYGFVRRNDPRVYVTPLPLLRGDPNGKDVVEGLILHELGHHRWHSGPVNDRVWAAAEKVKMHGLLNLVADEHLERNLRALEPEWGDKLKRLAAYAFQHADKEIETSELLRVLGVHASSVLSQCCLQVGHRDKHVLVDSGTLLRSLEARGHPFARFMRALRMGLGNRHADPKVARALALFTPSFRKLEMPALLEIAYELRRIFGDDVVLLDGFGGAETVDEGERARQIAEGGLSDSDVQPEVERILDPRKLKSGAGRGGGGGKLAINVSGVPHFDKISQVERLIVDPVAQAEAAREVAHPARKLRAFFEQLGIQRLPVRQRTTGTRLDRARLGRLVLLSDPRVLMARQPHFDTDLFLGILVDCSSSMAALDNIVKARRFAVLVSEAAKGLGGIDVRCFGFTDSVIYDAGDATRSAAASFEAGGGNNDAAALHHVAGVAKQSRRRAKLLVMISDGLPTDCSTEALSALVKRLENREKMVLAQVAVRPLEEQCFTHYVRLDEADMAGVVRRFGETIARLVKKALR